MPAPATVRQLTRIGLETEFGSGGDVTYQPTSFGLTATENVEAGSVTPPGAIYPTKSWTSYEDTSFAIESGTLSYDQILIPLSSVMEKVVPTTPAGATDARLWTFESSQWAAQAFQSFVAEVGDLGNPGEANSNRGGKSGAMFFSEVGWSVDPTSETVELSGSGMGKAIGTEGMTTTGVVTEDYEVALPNHFRLWVSDTPAGLGQSANQVDCAFSAGFSLGDRRSVVRYIQRALVGSYGDVVETVPSTEVPLTLADKFASPVDDMIAWAREGRTVFVRLEAVSPRTIESVTDVDTGTTTDLKYRITCDFACGLTDRSREDSQEVFSRNFSYSFNNDPDFGAYKVEVLNRNTTILG